MTAIASLLQPRSIAIIGGSEEAGSAGRAALENLKRFKYGGDVHLVSRTKQEMPGLNWVSDIDELPRGIDLALLAVPSTRTPDALEKCGARGTRAAIAFAAGFAEVGDYATQEAVTQTARAAGLAVVGPNCLGVTNNVDGMMLHMLFAREAKRGVKNGVAFVGQSGGLLGHFQRAAEGRGLPISYVISTGNEAGLESTDFIEFLADDPATRVIALYSEQIRRPAQFLAACRRARAAGKPVVVMQAGRSAKARKAAQSHTGALIGDFATMQTQVENAGAVVVPTMDEMTDLVEILVRFPDPPTKGPGVLTASGAYVGLTNDFAEEVGLDLPELTPQTLKAVTEILPSYGNYGNPLDVTAGFTPDSLPVVTKTLVDDPNVGMLFISFPVSYPAVVKAFNKGMAETQKPRVMVALGDTSPLGEDTLQAVSETTAVFSRSSDRMLRAIARYTSYGRSLARSRAPADPAPFSGMPKLEKGTQPEWLGKHVLRAAGIRVPEGDLARTADEAAAIAARIGYPVVLKAQAAALSHKTEAGGVMLNIPDEAVLRSSWDAMMASVKRAAPDVTLDGGLVEQMSRKGLELMVGAKRDPEWGTVLLVGLGGIWVEALGDVQLLPVDADEVQVVEALGRLRSAKLLAGVRGAPPADQDAIVETVLRIGRLMRTMPELTEIDINPLMVQGKGEGVTALDALIVAG